MERFTFLMGRGWTAVLSEMGAWSSRESSLERFMPRSYSELSHPVCLSVARKQEGGKQGIVAAHRLNGMSGTDGPRCPGNCQPSSQRRLWRKPRTGAGELRMAAWVSCALGKGH